MAYTVARRTNEIGIRMALGAERRKIVWMVLREVLALGTAGLALGLAIAWATSKFLGSFLFGVKHNDAWIDELLQALGLADKAGSNMRQLSGGMKRRVLVAQALVHRPPVIVLDEPTAGVDVELRQTLWQFVSRLNREGHTVLLTTHYLEEAEALCDEIALLRGGVVIARGAAAELRDRFQARDIGELYLRVMAA